MNLVEDIILKFITVIVYDGRHSGRRDLFVQIWQLYLNLDTKSLLL